MLPIVVGSFDHREQKPNSKRFGIKGHRLAHLTRKFRGSVYLRHSQIHWPGFDKVLLCVLVHVLLLFLCIQGRWLPTALGLRVSRLTDLVGKKACFLIVACRVPVQNFSERPLCLRVMECFDWLGVGLNLYHLSPLIGR